MPKPGMNGIMGGDYRGWGRVSPILLVGDGYAFLEIFAKLFAVERKMNARLGVACI
jgi:hypothetical protein